MSAPWADLLQFALRHRLLRTAASASTKLAAPLRYQLACRTGSVSGCNTLAIDTTSLKMPKRQGVVRSIALSDHWRNEFFRRR